MTVIGALSSFRELGELSPHKRACRQGLRLNLCIIAIALIDFWSMNDSLFSPTALELIL